MAFFAQPYQFPNFVQNYQTLLSGVFALLGAFIAWYSLERQIVSQQTFHEFSRTQEERAARAALTFLLSEMYVYTEQCAHYLRARYNSGNNETLFETLTSGRYLDQATCPSPQLVTNMFAVVRATTGDPQMAIASLLNKVQITDARLQSFHSQIKKDGWNELRAVEHLVYVVDVTEVQLRASQLFPFARFESDYLAPMLNSAMLRSHYELLDFGDIESEPEFFSLLTKRMKDWVAK